MIRAVICTPSQGRNYAAWLSISSFLATQNLQRVLQARLKAQASAGGEGDAGAHAACGGAGVSTLPVGNHGEIVLQVAKP